MDILIETATGNEIQRWSGVARRVTLPGETHSIGVYGVPLKRPLDLGPDHFLATATFNEVPLTDITVRGTDIIDVVGQAVTVTQTLDDMPIDDCRDCKIAAVEAAKDACLETGINWKLNPGDDLHPISIDDGMREFLSYTAILRGKGRTNSHNGKVHQGSNTFDIDDAGLEELSIFAAEWGLAIHRIALVEIGLIEAMTLEDLGNYNPDNIDWTVTWGGTDQTNGWSDSTLIQTP